MKPGHRFPGPAGQISAHSALRFDNQLLPPCRHVTIGRPCRTALGPLNGAIAWTSQPGPFEDARDQTARPSGLFTCVKRGVRLSMRTSRELTDSSRSSASPVLTRLGHSLGRALIILPVWSNDESRQLLKQAGAAPIRSRDQWASSFVNNLRHLKR
jgi:hypothetical protein